MFFLFISYSLLLLKYRKSPVCFLAFSLQLLSVVSAMVIDYKYEIQSVDDIFHLLFILFINYLFISPWKNFKRKHLYVARNEDQVNSFFKISVFPCFCAFVILSAVAFLVQTTVEDVDEFKYLGGNQDFYSSMPIAGTFLTIANIISPVTYVFIPLFFYYLNSKRYVTSMFCILLSLTTVINGLGFFSRWLPLTYMLMFMVIFLSIENNNKLIPRQVQSVVKKLELLVMCMFILFSCIEISVTISRFGEGTNNAASIDGNMSSKSKVTNPTLYSVLDYLGQSSINSLVVLSRYTGETMRGDMTFSGIRVLLKKVGISYDQDKMANKKYKLLKDEWNRFYGLPSQLVYDYGYFLTVVIALLYFCFVKSKIRYDNFIYVEDVMVLTPLLLLPLMSIFFSLAYYVVNYYLIFYSLKVVIHILYGKNIN